MVVHAHSNDLDQMAPLAGCLPIRFRLLKLGTISSDFKSNEPPPMFT